MSEPVAWRYKMIPPGWTYSDKKPDRDFFGTAWDRIQVTPLYEHPLPPADVVRDKRVAELETVLRECREALECVPKHFGMKRLGKSTLNDSETRVRCHKAIAKIDEVLNENR